MVDDRDSYFMRLALSEAQEGYNRDDFPVGAVLAVDGEYLGKGSNSTKTNREWSSHAESSLIRSFAPAIQRNKKDEKSIELYTTLEPCLMCLGTIVLNRITRIVYACPDPNGGAARLDPNQLGKWYVKKWPMIEQCNEFREESYILLTDYMRKHEKWKNILASFEDMHKQG